ncbi:hypothetical protein T4D_9503 [Trichinella pseudospiralis]|uniref:Transposon Ty3-I Gag-Pol polyprotein n=1 Tax=Trichinella pseudospiralis TaxID=6337 RepID=A0A0V1FRH9_TRIPS|nr:hypothetical protein T4D_9503 [Trichinella pseudospiralis]
MSIHDDLRRTSLVTNRIETERLVGQMLESGVIELASWPWSCLPGALVRKKDGSPRFCVDYRRLNAVTRVDAQPLLCIDDT